MVKVRLFYALCAILVAGCASTKKPSAPIVEARKSLYVAPLVVPAGVDSLLAPLGWTPGRFAAELAKEIRFQLNRKGVATPRDSTGVPDRLEIQVDHYDPSDYAIKGHLTTPPARAMSNSRRRAEPPSARIPPSTISASWPGTWPRRSVMIRTIRRATSPITTS